MRVTVAELVLISGTMDEVTHVSMTQRVTESETEHGLLLLCGLLPLPEASLATMCGSGRPSGSMSLGSSNFQYATRSLRACGAAFGCTDGWHSEWSMSIAPDLC